MNRMELQSSRQTNEKQVDVQHLVASTEGVGNVEVSEATPAVNPAGNTIGIDPGNEQAMSLQLRSPSFYRAMERQEATSTLSSQAPATPPNFGIMSVATGRSRANIGTQQARTILTTS